MILGIDREWSIFLQAVFIGNQIYLTYLLICVFRRILPHSLLWISVEDLLFWIGTGGYLYYRILQICSGSIRWYFVAGVFIGGMLTHRIVKKIHQKRVDKRSKKE